MFLPFGTTSNSNATQIQDPFSPQIITSNTNATQFQNPFSPQIITSNLNTTQITNPFDRQKITSNSNATQIQDPFSPQIITSNSNPPTIAPSSNSNAAPTNQTASAYGFIINHIKKDSCMDLEFKFPLFMKIPFEKYKRDFTLIVNDQKFKMNRIVADLLSPKIMKMHFSEETATTFNIKTRKYVFDKKEEHDIVNEIIDMVEKQKRIRIEMNGNFEGFSKDNDRKKFIYDILKAFKNGECLKMHSEFNKKLTIDNVIGRITKKLHFFSDNEKSSQIVKSTNLEGLDFIKEEIVFLSQHFYEMIKEQNYNNNNNYNVNKNQQQLSQQLPQQKTNNIYNNNNIIYNYRNNKNQQQLSQQITSNNNNEEKYSEKNNRNDKCHDFRNQIKSLDIEILKLVIENDQLRLENEESLLKLINELYTEDATYSVLYECVEFENIINLQHNQNGIKANNKKDGTGKLEINKFFEIFDINDLNYGIWKKLFSMFYQSINKQGNFEIANKRYDCGMLQEPYHSKNDNDIFNFN